MSRGVFGMAQGKSRAGELTAGRAPTLRQQAPTTCGGTVGAMVLKAFGKDKGRDAQQLMNEYFGGGSNITFGKLTRGAAKAGLTTSPARMSDLPRALADGAVVVAQLRDAQNNRHFVLVDGARNGQVRIKDPMDGSVKWVDSKEFEKQLNTAGGRTGMIAIRDPKAPSRNSSSFSRTGRAPVNLRGFGDGDEDSRVGRSRGGSRSSVYRSSSDERGGRTIAASALMFTKSDKVLDMLAQQVTEKAGSDDGGGSGRFSFSEVNR